MSNYIKPLIGIGLLTLAVSSALSANADSGKDHGSFTIAAKLDVNHKSFNGVMGYDIDLTTDEVEEEEYTGPFGGTFIFEIDTSLAECTNPEIYLSGVVDGTKLTSPSGATQDISNGWVSVDETGDWSIQGVFNGIGQYNQSVARASCLTEVKVWDDETLTRSLSYAFEDATNLTRIERIPSSVVSTVYMLHGATSFNQDISSWDVSSVTDMSRMFEDATSFNNGGVELNWGNKTSEVKDMTGVFLGATSFNQDISSWNTSNVTDMRQMFQYAYAFNNDNQLLDWDTSNVTSMRQMFYYASNFNQDISSWDVSSITNVNNMFYFASDFNNGGEPLDWGNNTSEVKDMSQMFYYASNFNQDISSWDVSSVTNMSRMFESASNFNNGGEPLDWGNNTSEVKNMSQMFYRVSSFNQDISSWDVSSVTNMSRMFESASDFNNGGEPLDWGNNTSEVKNMSQMFYRASSFNQDISSWDVSSVTNMSRMFQDARTFNQDVSNWDVSEVTNMSYMLSNTTDFNNGGEPLDWGNKTSKVTNMERMFYYAGTFNQDISSWDVSEVANMSYMFYYASNFNQDISNWDVSEVTNMSYMFQSSSAFDQDISSWDVSEVTNMSYMFQDASNFNNGGEPLDWGNKTSNVTNMRNMFSAASSFNQDISSWDVSNVTHMNFMFQNASNFNNGGEPLDWGNKTSKVTNMGSMFLNATSFNQDISNWVVPLISNKPTLFDNNTHSDFRNKPAMQPQWGVSP